MPGLVPLLEPLVVHSVLLLLPFDFLLLSGNFSRVFPQHHFLRFGPPGLWRVENRGGRQGPFFQDSPGPDHAVLAAPLARVRSSRRLPSESGVFVLVPRAK